MAKKTGKKTAKSKSAAKPARSAAQSGLFDEVGELIRLMVDHGLTEIGIEDGQKKISLRRDVSALGQPVAAPPAPAGVAPAAPPQTPEAEAPAEELLEIKSPMVGTFYSSPSPDSEPYVQVGSKVDEQTVVCIVEAMKVMNEIKAECAGTIAEVCVKNAQPVEYGQVLFRVRPS